MQRRMAARLATGCVGVAARGLATCGVVALAACGRVGFDAHGAAPDGPANPADDAPGTMDMTTLDATACDERPDLLFCDSYEGAPQLPDVEVFPPGVHERTTAQAYRGTRSLHSRTTNGFEQAWEVGTVLPGIASGDLYARWYLLLPSTNAVGVDLAGIHIIEQGAPNGAVSFEIENDQVGLELTTTPTVTRAISTTTFPRDRWVCVQLHLAIADAGGAATLAIDGTTVVERTGIDTRPATGFSNLHAGIFATSAANIMREVYTDEFAVARSPIPCD